MNEEEKIKLFYENTRKQIEHEDALINHRLTWLLMLQGFLFSAYGFSLSAEATAISKCSELVFFQKINDIRDSIALIGFVSSITLLAGVLAANRALITLVEEWNNFPVNIKNDFPRIIGGKLLGMYGGLIPTVFLPLFFCGLWYKLQPKLMDFFANSPFIIPVVISILIPVIFFAGRVFERRKNTSK